MFYSEDESEEVAGSDAAVEETPVEETPAAEDATEVAPEAE